ncbi:MAG: glycosyltransferase [Pseudomonadota bacterium]
MRPKLRAIKSDTTEWLLYLPALCRTQWQFARHGTASRAPVSEHKVVVSLTSFPDRFARLHNCMKSLLGQTRKPDRLVLYLTQEECADVPVPAALQKLVRHGLEIRYTSENLGSFNKFVHALTEFPGHVIVTCDDDKLYPSNWLGGLIDGHQKHPGKIVCWRSREITLTGDDQLKPYREWPLTTHNTPSFSILPLGVGGVLYPPGCFTSEVLDTSLFQALCPTADDLWLKTMAVRTGTPAVQVGPAAVVHPSIPFWNGSKLSVGNIWGRQNDAAVQRLIEHFGITPRELAHGPSHAGQV